MDRDPRLDELLGGIRAAPAGLTREDRVRLLRDFAQVMLAGREPDRRATMFVCGGIDAWLREGGSLTRDFWRTAGPQGCTVTEAVLARRLVEGSSRRAQDREEAGTVGASSTTERTAE